MSWDAVLELSAKVVAYGESKAVGSIDKVKAEEEVGAATLGICQWQGLGKLGRFERNARWVLQRLRSCDVFLYDAISTGDLLKKHTPAG